MRITKPKVHFIDKYLLSPANPIIIYLVGTGGTGSHVLWELGRMNDALNAYGHAGFHVQAFDPDIVTKQNCLRQPFIEADVGHNKATILINRVNRRYGTNWKAIPERYDLHTLRTKVTHIPNIIISCVDTVASRVEIAAMLKQTKQRSYDRYKTLYWIDFGNSKYSGQVIFSTVHPIQQPASKKFKPIKKLPFITDEFKHLLRQAEKEDTALGCSHNDPLHEQDLFINSALAKMGISQLWNTFRQGFTEYRGLVLNLKTCKMEPLKI